jgi:hypothetical protein
MKLMTSNLRQCLLTCLFLAALGVTGCMTPNIREVNIGQVSALARLREGKATYYQIEIRKPMNATAPHILLELPDGKIIDRTSFNYPALKKAGFMSPSEGDFNPGKAYSHELSRYGVSFFFNEGTLMLIRITQTTDVNVGIAGVRKKEFKTLPFTQEDLEKIFGRPDKTAEGYQL